MCCLPDIQDTRVRSILGVNLPVKGCRGSNPGQHTGPPALHTDIVAGAQLIAHATGHLKVRVLQASKRQVTSVCFH